MMNLEGGQNKLGRQREQPLTTDLGEVVESLLSESFEAGPKSITQAPRVYTLKRSITPKSLESLGALSFENMLYEVDDKLVLATGQETSAEPDYSFSKYPHDDFRPRNQWESERLRQLHGSRFNLHNHPITGTMHSYLNNLAAVSAGDIQVISSLKTSIGFMINRDGITGFKPREIPRGKFSLPSINADPLSSGTKTEKPVNTHAYKFENPDRTRRRQQEAGITKFFIPFRGDESSEKKLQLICDFINDPSIEWASIAEQIEKED